MSIADFKEKIKAFHMSDDAYTIAIIVVMIIVAVGSFCLGRISKNGSEIRTFAESIQTPENQAIPGSNTNISNISQNSTISQNNTINGGLFIASKNGTKYYPAGCNGINKIKPENRISFETEEKAQASGRTRSSTCH